MSYHAPQYLTLIAGILGLFATLSIFILYFKLRLKKMGDDKNTLPFLLDLFIPAILQLACVYFMHPGSGAKADFWTSVHYESFINYIVSVVCAHIGLGILINLCFIGLMELTWVIYKRCSVMYQASLIIIQKQ